MLQHWKEEKWREEKTEKNEEGEVKPVQNIW